MSADTQQNLFYTIYFLFLHNFGAIFYLSGAIITGVINFVKPKRTWFLIFLGFLILLFAFEYDKHIVEGLKEQTTQSLITERQSYRIAYVINVTLDKLLPKLLTGIGWLLVLGGGIWEGKKFKIQNTKIKIND